MNSIPIQNHPHTHQHHKEIEHFFNNHAPNWDSYKTKEELQAIENLLSLVNIPQNSIIIDIGCGTGILVPYLLKHIKNSGLIIETDLSPQMIQYGKNKFKNNSYTAWLIADAHDLPVKDHSVNAIICFSVFPHLINQQKAMIEHARILAPNGIWVLCHTKPRREINKFHKNLGGIVGNHIIPDKKTILNMLKQAQLKLQYFQDNSNGYLLIASPQTSK
ncbi:MAG TPA: methyltransferase domain-containing protein [Candidatus Hydrogenedens sp.]|nr:methyltransferase domain-containing protein [Candidatus Hydrogenedens sp.]